MNPVSIELPAKTGTYQVRFNELQHYEEIFPNINVAQEFCFMQAWLEANPEKRKKNTKRFIANWLIRATQKAYVPSRVQMEAQVGRYSDAGVSR